MLKLILKCSFCAQILKIRKDGMMRNVNKKRIKIQDDVREFNRVKNAENRKRIFDCKRDYKYFWRKIKQHYLTERRRKMNNLRKRKPKDFWKIFRNKQNTCSHNISDTEFFNYFKELSSENLEMSRENIEREMQNFDCNSRESTFDELDRHIIQNEIKDAISWLASNKACGSDCIKNEYFKFSSNMLLEPLKKLFNRILNSGVFPTQWSEGINIPIHKKGDIDDPSNYRGITLVCCFAKLFTSLLICWITA